MRYLGLEGARSTSAPTSDERPEPAEPLDHKRYRRYQSICARAEFLSTDSMGLQFVATQCCRAMSKPTVRYLAWRLKRIGRCIEGRPRMRCANAFQTCVLGTTTYSDANLASNAEDRKSTSGGNVMHGSRSVESWKRLILWWLHFVRNPSCIAQPRSNRLYSGTGAVCASSKGNAW